MSFKTSSDTEVLLAAYVCWGEKCLERFNGMWSFAIHDERDNTLFCARDRFGVKPFYYVDTPTEFAFGSEIRQLLPLMERVIAEDDLVSDFLVCGLTDHTDRTFLQGHQKTAAGAFASRRSVDRPDRGRALLFARSWLRRPTKKQRPTCFVTCLRTPRGCACAPTFALGPVLSGGLDSSSVATLAAKRYSLSSNEAFFAITAVSQQASNNEEQYAAEVVKDSGLNWLRTEPTYEDFASTAETLIDVQEEPFAGPSIMMQYEVMKTARSNGVIVLLDGQGGDETLLGYERYYAAWLLDHFRQGGIPWISCRHSVQPRVNANVPPQRLAMYFFGASSRRCARWLIDGGTVF